MITGAGEGELGLVAVILALWTALRQKDCSKAFLDSVVKPAGDTEEQTYTWMTSDTRSLN